MLLEQPLPDLAPELPLRSARIAPTVVVPPRAAPPSVEVLPASIMRRLMAGIVDLGVLSGIDLLVVYFTIQICGLAFADVGMLPKVPLIAFLALLAVGYNVAFTTGGQTMGQMALGVCVVSERTSRPPGLTRAAVRTLLWLMLLLPAGLGLFSILLDDHRRGLHDRFAATRVVRAGA